MRSNAVRLSALVLAFSVTLSAVTNAQFGNRPPVPAGADPNDWEAYYDAAVALLPSDTRAAERAFEWASHLRPDRAEPLYGRWIAFWARDIDRFAKYLRDDEKILRDPQVLRADSLRVRALRRNPFVHQGLILFLYDKLPGRFRDDDITLAWISFGQAELPLALERFASLVRRDPRHYGYLRFIRASAFVNTGRPDSALAQIATLLDQLRAEDARTLGSTYESKELLEYATGLLHLQARRAKEARDAFGRAVVENAAFAPAHAMLGALALTARDSATALLEYGLATETDRDDVEFLMGHGQALRFAGRRSEAAAQLRKAVALEPLYAAPYFLLASVLEESGDRAAAAEAYKQFVVRATRGDPRRAAAEQKLKALAPGSAS